MARRTVKRTTKKRSAARPRRAARKVAVITGGGTGLGRHAANRLTGEGFSVAVIGRRANRLKPRRGEKLHGYMCDVRDRAAIKRTVKAILDDLGRIDVLINAAGVVGGGPLTSLTEEVIRNVIDINLIGTINFTQACVPALKKTKGAIINFSSGVAHRPDPGASLYAASKGGVETFSKAVAVELAPHNVRCNVISPAAVPSEILIAQGMSKKDYTKFMRERGKIYPLKRCGRPEEVSELVSYLVSDNSTWVTGIIVPMDGGKSVG